MIKIFTNLIKNQRFNPKYFYQVSKMNVIKKPLRLGSGFYYVNSTFVGIVKYAKRDLQWLPKPLPLRLLQRLGAHETFWKYLRQRL